MPTTFFLSYLTSTGEGTIALPKLAQVFHVRQTIPGAEGKTVYVHRGHSLAIPAEVGRRFHVSHYGRSSVMSASIYPRQTNPIVPMSEMSEWRDGTHAGHHISGTIGPVGTLGKGEAGGTSTALPERMCTWHGGQPMQVPQHRQEHQAGSLPIALPDDCGGWWEPDGTPTAETGSGSEAPHPTHSYSGRPNRPSSGGSH